MLGYRDSGMPDSEANADPESLRPGAARRGGRPAGRDHPPRPPAGDRHLRRRAERLPAPRPPPGARDQHAGLRRAGDPTGTPRPASRGSRRSSTTRPGRGRASSSMHAKYPRARPRVAVQPGVVRPAVAGRPHHHLRSTSTGYATCAPTRCSPTAPRSTRPRRSGSGCPDEVARRSTRYDDYVLARSAGRPLRRPRTTCSPGSGPRADAPRARAGADEAHKYLTQEWLDSSGSWRRTSPSGPVPRPACSTSSGVRRMARCATTRRWTTGGWSSSPLGEDPDAEVTLTQTYADSVQMRRVSSMPPRPSCRGGRRSSARWARSWR